jgi:DNA processing protein
MPFDRDGEELRAALRLARLPGVGAARFKELVARAGSARAALAAFEGVGTRPRLKSALAAGLERADAWLAAGGRGVVLGQPDYPSLLAELGEPPPFLLLRGEVGALAAEMVAIVGARQIDEASGQLARRLGALAAARGLGVVSGGARGTDGAALGGALAAGGLAVAVLGSGVDIDYPPEHAALFAGIAAAGAVVSELLPGAPPMRGFFVTRNRILAGLARGVIVVRGSATSGSLATARWARRLGRPVAAMDGGVDGLDGAARLLRAGGAPLLGDLDAADRWLGTLTGSLPALSRSGAGAGRRRLIDRPDVQNRRVPR